MNDAISKYITNLLSVILSVITGTFALFPANLDRLEVDKSEQIERIAQLENVYSTGTAEQINEADFFYGDLKAALENGIKFNELRFVATHNSYQTKKTDEYIDLYGNVSDLTFGLVNSEKAEFYSDTLTQQLNLGVRSFEMDIETFKRNGEISFTCMHAPYSDMTTSCYDFSLALKEIKMWSDYNPNHLPITIIIEPKSGFLPLEDMKSFNLDYALKLDEALKAALGDKLFTPADMLRDYESFGEMRKADDWCKAQDMLGKVLVLLHDCKVTGKYIEVDESIKTQAMFPMLREKDIDRDCTSFILANDPEEFLKISEDALYNKRIIARTRADKYGDYSGKQREDALECGAQIVSTDYPPKTDERTVDYIFSFSNKKTITSITY